MPEGHTIHRLARLHWQDLGGRALRAWSPQGRFAEGAARLDGRAIERVEAHGKHLFHRWEGGLTLHVHLGLFGVFRTHHGAAPPPSAATRLALAAAAPDVAAYLAGPTACELLAAEEERALRARLGPDPLSREDGAEEFVGMLARRRGPVGGALLDQRVVAGVGNVYRAEALFVRGLHPDVPARDLGPGEAAGLWETLRTLMADGERSGRIHTVAGPDEGAGPPARYVYRRAGQPCRRCGSVVRSWQLASRAVYACLSCQPPRDAASGGGRP